MRLHRLEITAFGPYPRHESVDLDALATDGLFLLHGDTGAGKTTLLDAVAFALFGTVPGARGETKRLRCDYADPDVLTEVCLELTVQGKRLRLVRRPEYERAKRDGTGVTVQRAKATLTWLDPAPSGHAPDGLSRIDEVNRTVGRLVGMTAAQFFQVVLLPQGDFARFLRAETTERERLLETLFGTQRFADVERWFREARAARGREVDAARQTARELIARIAQAAGDEPPAEDTPVDADWLAELRGRLAASAAGLRVEDQQARVERDVAETELTACLDLAQRVRRVAGAQATLAALARDAPARAEIAEELSAARRCASVVVADAAARAADAEFAAAHVAEQDAVGQLAALPPADRAAEPGRLGELGGALSQQAGELRQLVVEAAQQQLDEATLGALAERAASRQAALGALAEQLASLPDRLLTVNAERDEAMRAAAQLPGSRDRVAELGDLLRAADQLPAAQQRAEQAGVRRRAAVDAHQQARDALLSVRQARLEGMAAELAGGLLAGQPCPVCGSAAHPRPATATIQLLGERDEQAAELAEQRAHQERELCTVAANDAEHLLATVRERLAGRTAVGLAGEHRVAAAELARVGELAELAPARTELVRRLETEAAQLRAQQVAAEREQAAAKAEQASLAAVVAERAQRLAAARGDYPDVAARRAHLLGLVAGINSLAEARTARQAAARRQLELNAAAQRSATEAGFEDVATALVAAREAAAIGALTERLATGEQREATAKAVLAEPELAGLDAGTEVDVDSATLRRDETRKLAEGTNAALLSAERRVGEVTELAGRLASAWQRFGPAVARHAELAALTDVVNGRGQNARQMSLRSYVLAARLAEVAAAATLRLHRMSQGRYTFVHSDAGGPRGTRGGLGLDVLDDYSGRVRPAKTLSGGESFLASLTLALGLADVVAAETGGAVLDTLFIDEGFGTLDADTLDLVMDTLDELRAGGRVVGLVSHVEELRQRIPVRLRVRRARTGSTLELSGLAG